MKAFSRFLCLLLVLCLTSFSLVACNSSSSQETTSSAPPAESSGEQNESSFRLEKQDFGGVTIKVLTCQYTDYFQCEIAPQTISSEPVNDASYNRAVLLSQEYGINLEQVFADNENNLMDTARTMITSNLDEYQIYCGAIYYLSTLCVDDLFVDLANIKSNDYIDLNQSYWDQSLTRDLSLMGSVYFATGDAIVTDDESTWAIFFNKEIAENYSLADKYDAASLYDIVKSGNWTLDVMHEMAKVATSESGDSKMEYSANTPDTWGIVSQCYDSYALTAGCGQTLVRNEASGPVITIGEEANVSAFAKVFDLLTDSAYVAIAEKAGQGTTTYYEDLVQIFANGKALFMPTKVQVVSDSVMREADIRYGILPMPKLNTMQDDYTSTVTVYFCSALAIPVTNVEKFDATCYAMEALAYYGQQQVTPEYYDRTLKNKRFEDTESEDMLDLIFRNRTFDMGAVFNFGNMLYFYTNILISGLNGGSNDHISTYEKNQTVYQTAIDQFVQLVQGSQAS